jgi:tetratricopeptide (TPR) repeat protein
VLLVAVGWLGAAWLLARFDSGAASDVEASSTPADDPIDWFDAARQDTAVVSSQQVPGSLELQTRLAERETTDAAAYELYSQATRLIDAAVHGTRSVDGLLSAVGMLTQAVERDPGFATAYYQLAHAHDQLYSRFDRTRERRAQAKQAIDALRRLRPNAGETHLAMGKHLYWTRDDFNRARRELELGAQLLPEDPVAPLLLAYIDRRQGRWQESTAGFIRAIALDPQNVLPLQQLSLNYFQERRFREMAETMDRVIALRPDDLVFRAQRAAIELHWHANTQPVRQFITTALGPGMQTGPDLTFNWFDVAIHERDGVDAHNAVALMLPGGCHFVDVPFPRSWCEGMAARLRNDGRTARAEFKRARDEAAQLIAERPDYSGAFCALGMAEAALGNKQAAIRAGRRAVELEPTSKDALDGPVFLGLLGVIYSWSGETELAVQQIDAATAVPSFWSYGTLKLHPYWDAVRDDPQFQLILARLAPKD